MSDDSIFLTNCVQTFFLFSQKIFEKRGIIGRNFLPILRIRRSAGNRLARRWAREPRPYEKVAWAAVRSRAGRPGGRPLRKRILWCVGEGLCSSRGRGRTPPLRMGYKRCGAKRNPPVGCPFRQGGHGDGDADCHDQFANWSRNDTFYKRCGTASAGGQRRPPLRRCLCILICAQKNAGDGPGVSGMGLARLRRGETPSILYVSRFRRRTL